jgi:hypothetical protein
MEKAFYCGDAGLRRKAASITARGRSQNRENGSTTLAIGGFQGAISLPGIVSTLRHQLPVLVGRQVQVDLTPRNAW